MKTNEIARLLDGLRLHRFAEAVGTLETECRFATGDRRQRLRDVLAVHWHVMRALRRGEFIPHQPDGAYWRR